MTVVDFFHSMVAYSLPILIFLAAAPWIAWGLCVIIPGRREESFLLSGNMTLAVIAILVWAAYLVFAVGSGGWVRVVNEADIFLLITPPYYIIASILLSRRRMDLDEIPAYRTLQSIGVLVAVYVVVAWFADRVRIIFFSYIPATFFLWMIGIMVLAAWWAIRRMGGKSKQE